MELTKPQKSIYKMEKLAGGSIANICGSILVSKDVSVGMIQKAVNELYRLNDALRIRIAEKNGAPYQYVTEYKEQEFEILRFNCKEEFDEYASEYAKEAIGIQCALAEIRIVILPDKKGIIAKLHHIISDAWTLSLIGTQFNKAITGEEVQANSYANYVDTEKKYLDSKRYIKDKEFFLSQCKECDELIFLSEKQDSTFKAKRQTFVIEKKDVEKVLVFAKENNASVFSLFLTAIAIYINRTKMNTEKFFVGTSVLNRSGVKEQNTMGMFVNTVPVLVELDNEKSFYLNLSAIETSVVSVLRHQKYNYSSMLEELRNKYNLNTNLYDVVLNYQNAKVFGDGFESTWYHSGMQIESLQISIDDRDSKGILKINYDYRTDKFTSDEIMSIHYHIFNLLYDCMVNCNKRICDIEVLSKKERNRIHIGFNATDHKYDIPDNSTLYSLFEKTAKENPEKICIKTAERELSFGEFLSVAEKTDSKIRDITGNKKSVIAVIAERSTEMYGAIYGIIRGGNAYLPIDPEYPQERIEYILENSNAAVVAVQGKFAGLTRNIPCVDMTEILNSTEKNQENIPVCNAAPEDTAYVIYTSGSTGNPKGAKISHRSAVNRILWMHDKYPLDRSGVILQKTPYTFDVSVWEHFWWGMTGGYLAVSKPGEHFIPAKILEDVYKNSVTHLHFVPSVFDLFLNYLEAHTEELYKFNSVKHVFLSGEALSASLVQRFYRLYDCNNVGLHNLYGPTECTVDVSFYDCCPEDTDPVPIGKPVYNTQLYIVDKYMKTVPVGVQGEICIAGMNVGQGYLNNPELTAEKFIDNPFGAGKLYKTGDIGYWREDGNIVFVGRKDSQIKLNGQRIELGEIEAAINGICGVSSSAVIVKKANGSDILAAFFTGEAEASYIKEVCSESLPSYMVPAAFMHLDKLPLNPSGKLDRKALSATDVELSLEEEFSAPENETEKLICEVFSRVLNVKNVGRNSDFFSMGGTSLSMISILSEDAFEGVTAADFIRNSTPARLARILVNAEEKSLTYLEPLYKADNAENVLILFPYAGGGAEAFSKLVSDFTVRNKDASVYFVRYLHSSEECEKAADEIINTLREKNISVYSHCVGAAVALQIIKILEDRKVPVKHYFAGAVIPPSRPNGKNIWNKVSDGMLKAILIKAGAPLNNLSENEVADMLKRFREDTDFANASFAQMKGKIKTPVSVIISKRDLFTVNYMQAERLWKRYAENPAAIYFMNSKNHYFQNSSTEKIIVILQKFM